jgi:formylglycine-generating enzyme required for sulfatase activity
MGCLGDDPDCLSSEMPLHNVWFNTSFKIMAAEVQQWQYKAVTGINPSFFGACGDSCPVETVSWGDAAAFCRAIGGRLPSESEWEYASRAPAPPQYLEYIYSCGGLGDTCPIDYAWFENNAGSATHPVMKKKANNFGLFDMAGNVAEWVEDDWHNDYSSESRPDNGSAWVDRPRSSQRVERGGAFDSPVTSMRSSQRDLGNATGDLKKSVGFRCAKTYIQPEGPGMKRR